MDIRHFFAILTTAATTIISTAQKTAWSYTDCINYARQNNISLQQSAISEQVANENLLQSKAEWHPTLDFATSHSYSNYPWGEQSSKNTYSSNYGLNTSWTVWNGRQRENTIKRDKIQTEISKLNTVDIFRTLETDLLQVYINILYALESVNIYSETEKLSQAQAQRAKQLMEAGRLSRVDYTQLQSQYEQDHYNLVNARGTFYTRRMELKRLLQLGIDSTMEIVPVYWDKSEVMAELPPMDESYSMAVDTDIRIQALKLQKESATADIDIAAAGNSPSVSLNAGIGTAYSTPGPAFGNQLKQRVSESVGLTLSIPIFDNRRTKTAKSKAQLQKINAELDIQSRLTEIAQNVEAWYIDLRAAQSRYAAGIEQEKAAQLSHDIVNEQFSLGLVNTVELMTAHNNLLQARHSLLQAKYMAMLGHKMIQFYRTAQITLP